MSDTDPTVRSRRSCSKCGRETKKIRRGMCKKCYQDERAAAIAAGTFESGYVDPGPVREHILALIDAGIHQAAIARAAGINSRRIQLIQHRQTGQRGIQRKTAQRILAVPVPDVRMVGAARRVQALVALGYPIFELAYRLRISGDQLGEVALNHPRTVDPDLDTAIRALYDQLHLIPGPSADARKQARNCGWAAPFSWESTAALDDPRAVPEGVPPRPSRPGIPPDFAEMVADHRALGHSDSQIALAMEISFDALQSRFRKFGIAAQPKSVAF